MWLIRREPILGTTQPGTRCMTLSTLAGRYSHEALVQVCLILAATCACACLYAFIRHNRLTGALEIGAVRASILVPGT